MPCAIRIHPVGGDMSRLKWGWVSHRLILEAFKNQADRWAHVCMCAHTLDAHIVCTVKIPELLKRLQNQYGLFIHESNPQIYCHLICVWQGLWCSLMLSNRCPCSAFQVRLHLMTPLSHGSRHISAFLRWQLLHEDWHCSSMLHKRKSYQMFKTNMFDPKIFFGKFDLGANINITCWSGWLLSVFCLPLPSKCQTTAYPACRSTVLILPWIEILCFLNLKEITPGVQWIISNRPFHFMQAEFRRSVTSEARKEREQTE